MELKFRRFYPFIPRTHYCAGHVTGEEKGEKEKMMEEENSKENTNGRAIAQAVSRWLPTAAGRGSKPDLVM
jgi:hypothetical protein